MSPRQGSRRSGQARRTTARRPACRCCARLRPRRSPRRAAFRRSRARPRRDRAKPFLFFTILATGGPGDEVIYPDPGFPIYESAVRFAGATPVPLPLREERGFSFDPDELDSLLGGRTRLVILNAPQNPTGGVIPRPTCGGRPTRSSRRPPWVLSDEVYRRITYDVDAPSIATHARDARPHGRARRLLEDVRNDRVANGLRGSAGASSSTPSCA